MKELIEKLEALETEFYHDRDTHLQQAMEAVKKNEAIAAAHYMGMADADIQAAVRVELLRLELQNHK